MLCLRHTFNSNMHFLFFCQNSSFTVETRDQRALKLTTGQIYRTLSSYSPQRRQEEGKGWLTVWLSSLCTSTPSNFCPALSLWSFCKAMTWVEFSLGLSTNRNETVHAFVWIGQCAGQFYVNLSQLETSVRREPQLSKCLRKIGEQASLQSLFLNQ